MFDLLAGFVCNETKAVWSSRADVFVRGSFFSACAQLGTKVSFGLAWVIFTRFEDLPRTVETLLLNLV